MKRTLTQEQILQIQTRIEICYQQAEQKLKRTFIRPQLELNGRGRIAGSANLTLNKLRLNPILFKHNQDEFMQEVIPHEICHLLCYQLFGRTRPHGVQWRSLMQGIFNLPGRATHSMDLAPLQQKSFAYQCKCGPVSLTIRRHNKVLKGAQYLCRKCATVLTYKAS
ncbi:SprT family zinc-dependent metalloprotease [Paraferrimonas sp. SM1919]|uniref:SprT family zinc-dependent metalloprotease n=1 Tax=Paraferrimonas sp. SM1919 TaxID=2662263 RepID=UPI0013D5016F|nr:SprT family zinc-dependent metalloprotease [Paraferrimonas sp. SM1919]